MKRSVLLAACLAYAMLLNAAYSAEIYPGQKYLEHKSKVDRIINGELSRAVNEAQTALTAMDQAQAKLDADKAVMIQLDTDYQVKEAAKQQAWQRVLTEITRALGMDSASQEYSDQMKLVTELIIAANATVPVATEAKRKLDAAAALVAADQKVLAGARSLHEDKNRIRISVWRQVTEQIEAGL